MASENLVSVVIPTYNHADFLRQALQSVMDQTYPHWEAIIVDNHSTDHTDEVLRAFPDPRIRVIRIHNNGVIAASRNRGIAEANGKYVAFLDSDDVWHPEKLTHTIKAFQADVGLVSHGLRCFGARTGEMYPGPSTRATADGLIDFGCCMTPSATVVLKTHLDAVGCFSESPKIATSEDYHLWIKLAKIGIRMIFLKEILGEYRIHSSNQSNSVERHLQAVLCVVDEFLPASSKLGWVVTFRRLRRYALAYYGAGRGMQNSHRYAASLPFLLRAIGCWPLSIRAYAGVLIGLLGIAGFRIHR